MVAGTWIIHGQTGVLKTTWSVIITEVGGRSHPSSPQRNKSHPNVWQSHAAVPSEPEDSCNLHKYFYSVPSTKRDSSATSFILAYEENVMSRLSHTDWWQEILYRKNTSWNRTRKWFDLCGTLYSSPVQSSMSLTGSCQPLLSCVKPGNG